MCIVDEFNEHNYEFFLFISSYLTNGTFYDQNGGSFFRSGYIDKEKY